MLRLVVVLVELQNTCKKMLERPKTYAIFLKSWGFKDVKFDIPMCQSHSTRPQPIQLVPTMQKSSLCHHFRQNSWKFGSQKLLTKAHFWLVVNFLFPQCKPVPGAYLSKNVTLCDTPNTPKMTGNGRIWAKNGKKTHCGKLRNHLSIPKIEK